MWVQENNPVNAYKSVVAMSQMTSMLHDNDRNRKYFRSIRAAVGRFIDQHGRAPHVLDIGAGTGAVARVALH